MCLHVEWFVFFTHYSSCYYQLVRHVFVMALTCSTFIGKCTVHSRKHNQTALDTRHNTTDSLLHCWIVLLFPSEACSTLMAQRTRTLRNVLNVFTCVSYFLARFFSILILAVQNNPITTHARWTFTFFPSVQIAFDSIVMNETSCERHEQKSKLGNRFFLPFSDWRRIAYYPSMSSCALSSSHQELAHSLRCFGTRFNLRNGE